MDRRKRRESQTQISAQRAAISNGRVEIRQDATMAVVVPESTEPSDARIALISVDSGYCSGMPCSLSRISNQAVFKLPAKQVPSTLDTVSS
ncbi:hypothetical protein NDU88_006918 [Pleurodeles waltl]|uniref:Uncharacterized protein n=1 Tax=Pleurodeles waltl TaxID=8319 RepID=A0AAV7MH68_PLEWA|nr:hypothetical protein NDU88_006918 [Pleurodeles waltl]